MFIYPDNFLYRNAAEFVCNDGLTQLVDTPTRGNNVLDLVLCSDVLSCCDNMCLLPSMGTSDHDVVSFSLGKALCQPIVVERHGILVTECVTENISDHRM